MDSLVDFLLREQYRLLTQYEAKSLADPRQGLLIAEVQVPEPESNGSARFFFFQFSSRTTRPHTFQTIAQRFNLCPYPPDHRRPSVCSRVLHSHLDYPQAYGKSDYHALRQVGCLEKNRNWLVLYIDQTASESIPLTAT